MKSVLSVTAATLLYSVLTCHVTVVTSQTCDIPNSIGLPPIFFPSNGGMLSRCTFNGQQCCHQFVIDQFDGAMRLAINSGKIQFTRSFADAQKAVDEMRKDATAILEDTIENVIKPLLLSPVSPPTSDFTAEVNDAVEDINTALTGSNVDLKVTFRNYFKAIAVAYFDKAVGELFSSFISRRISNRLASCASEALFNQIYSTTDSAVHLIDLLHNITRAVGVIQQLPPRFNRLLATLSKFQFSSTCLDVFSTNYLCPLCRNQPLMCPGRCAEVVAGCVSPLNQAIVQLDASLKMILSIVKGLAGTSDSVTNSVEIKRIPVLYENLVASVKTFNFVNLNFVKRLLTTCGFRFPSFPGFGKRSLVHKRASNFDIPKLDMDELKSLLDTLEKRIISSLGENKIASVTEDFCSPNFSVEFPVQGFNVTLRTTAANGMCSYGAGNTGTYNSTFFQRDIIDQAYGNPAGNFNYTQLLSQAKTQTYVLTELFNETDISESIFSVFVPDETLPTITFLSAEPPIDPSPSTAPPAIITDPTTIASSPEQPTDPNPSTAPPATITDPTTIASTPLVPINISTDAADATDVTDTGLTSSVEPSDSTGLVFSYSLIIMLGCSLLAMLQ